MSIGIAMFPAQTDGTETLQKRADAALYLAKHGGRNRVEVATASTEWERKVKRRG